MGSALGCAAVSGRHAPHLQRRSGIFHLRLRVPDALKVRVGMVEVRRSLQTYSPERARFLVAIYVPRLRKRFQVVYTGSYSREQARSLVLSCFNDLQSSVDGGYLPSSGEPDLELAEQEALATDQIRQAEQSIASRRFPGSLLSTASELSAAHGWSFEELPEQDRHDLLEGVTRAVIEQQKLFILRLGDRLAPYVPADPIFRSAINCTAGPMLSRTSKSECLGPSLSHALSSYLDHGRGRWTAKTHAGRTRQLRYLEEHFGEETRLTTITTANIRAYRDELKRLRSNHHRTAARTFLGKQTDNETHRISSKTAALMFEGVKAFFRWATEVEGYLPSNPAENVRIEITKGPKGSKPRRPFSEQELCTLFSQPLFTGCASANRRFMTGSAVIRDEYFWIPVLAYYTGARMGELVQLHLSDFHLTGSAPFFEVTEVNGGKAGSDNAKHVKSAAGVRKVPIHPDVIELGFSEFVSARRKHRKPSDRLFFRIAFGSDGQASTVFSKWFARFLDKANLGDPKLVFHSFRHNAEDAFRDALQLQYVIDRIIGHTDGSTSAGYGDGVSLETAHSAVCAMKLNVRLPKLWGSAPGENFSG